MQAIIGRRASVGYTLVLGAEVSPGTLTAETLYDCKAKELPAPKLNNGTSITDAGAQTIYGTIDGFGMVKADIPQDNKRIGYRMTEANRSLQLIKAGEANRIFLGKVTQDGGVKIDPKSTDGQGRDLEFVCNVPEITVNMSALTAGVKDSAYSKSIAPDCDARYVTTSMALKDGSTLPTGLSLSTAGVVSGTPTAAGTSTGTIVMTVTTNTGEVFTVELTYSITITAS